MLHNIVTLFGDGAAAVEMKHNTHKQTASLPLHSGRWPILKQLTPGEVGTKLEAEITVSIIR